MLKPIVLDSSGNLRELSLTDNEKIFDGQGDTVILYAVIPSATVPPAQPSDGPFDFASLPTGWSLKPPVDMATQQAAEDSLWFITGDRSPGSDNFTWADAYRIETRDPLTLIDQDKKFEWFIGNASDVTFLVPHNLDSTSVSINIYETGGALTEVFADVEITSLNTCTIKFLSAPSINQFIAIIKS